MFSQFNAKKTINSKEIIFWLKKGLMFGLYGLVYVFGMFYSGVVFSQLWSWFISSTFNIPPISHLQAVGILLTTSYLFPAVINENKNKITVDGIEQATIKLLVRILVINFLFLVVGNFVYSLIL